MEISEYLYNVVVKIIRRLAFVYITDKTFNSTDTAIIILIKGYSRLDYHFAETFSLMDHCGISATKAAAVVQASSRT